MSLAANERLIVGLKPWLPWPLSRWRAWTEPVRAERLAALRIAMAAVLLFDLLTTYVPILHDFYGEGSLGDPEIFSYRFKAPRWNWSLLRGLGDPLNWSVALTVWLTATVWVFLGLSGRLKSGQDDSHTPYLGWGLFLWIIATLLFLPGLWTRKEDSEQPDGLVTFFSGLALWMIASGYLLLGLWKRLHRPLEDQDPHILPLVVAAWTVASLFFVMGIWRVLQDGFDADDFWSLAWAQKNMAGSHRALDGAMVVLIVFAVFMLLGFWTKFSVVMVWLLSLSFENMNSYNDNAGDQVRGIALFYLVITPCGAAWSLDSWLARWWGRRQGRWARWLGRPDQPVYVYPWALRLLLIQMAFIYCCNGLFKLMGPDWVKGNSLYYVLNDLELARWSYAQIRVPLWLTRLMTWTVLVWEVCFPFFMLVPWMLSGLLLIRQLRSKTMVFVVRLARHMRTLALLFGVSFHLGIAAAMELGFFGPYMICLYAPLVPWERWIGRRSQVNRAAVGFSTRAKSS